MRLRTVIDFERNTVSATWPEAVRRLAASFLHDPVRITVGSDDLTANSRVAQGMLFRLTCWRLLRIPRN